MTIVWGLALGVGALLVAAPFLWPVSRRRLRRAGLLGALHEKLMRAGMSTVQPAALIAVSVILAISVGAIVFAVVPVTVLALAAGAVALVVPVFVVGWRGKARRRASRVLWPDVVDHLVSGVRSGLALPDSVATLAHTGPPLTREAFAEFETHYRTTGNFSLCLDSLKGRLADATADRILETLRMSREVGGSELTTVLRSLAAYLRQESAVRSELEARQSWLVNAARLGIAAPWIVLLLLATRPEAAAAYNTGAGAILIVTGLGVTVVAYRVMIALGSLPDERRWFR
jgi:tight adherence protein B